MENIVFPAIMESSEESSNTKRGQFILPNLLSGRNPWTKSWLTVLLTLLRGYVAPLIKGDRSLDLMRIWSPIPASARVRRERDVRAAPDDKVVSTMCKYSFGMSGILTA